MSEIEILNIFISNRKRFSNMARDRNRRFGWIDDLIGFFFLIIVHAFTFFILPPFLSDLADFVMWPYRNLVFKSGEVFKNHVIIKNEKIPFLFGIKIIN